MNGITHAHCRCMDIGNTCKNRHYADCDLCVPNGNQLKAHELLKRKQVTELTIVPSGRIDYCCECKKEHGYDCPLDKPTEPILYTQRELLEANEHGFKAGVLSMKEKFEEFWQSLT